MRTTSNNESEAARLTANKVASELRRLISLKKRATLVIDAHGLPDTFFNFLSGSEGIDWTQVIVILAREFTGVNGEHPQSMRHRILEQLISRVPIVEFVAPRADAPNPSAALVNFNALFNSKGADLVVRDRSAAITKTDFFGLTERQLEDIPQILFENNA